MQLVDTVFLILPVATLQAYVGMACSSPESQCPGRNGFDALLFLAVLGAITSGTLCFVSLDLHEKPPSYTWAQYWTAHKAHLSEMAAKTVFRFLELSARITTIALFSAAHGGWVFFIFFMHAVIVLAALRFWPRLVGGGVPNRNVWQKFIATKETVIKARFWPDKWRRLRVAILDDSKLLLAVMIWPPSMFVANATDKNGKFWWRSKTCPRKSFLSVNRVDAIFPLPAVVAVQVFEAMLMLVIVGASISEYPHYHNYYLIAFLANMAWLAAAVGWMSAASLWNPFLPEGPPLGLPTATLHPGRTPGRPAREEDDEECPGTEWRPHEGWGGDTPAPARGVKSIGGAPRRRRREEARCDRRVIDAGRFRPIGPGFLRRALPGRASAHPGTHPRGSSVVRSRRRIAGEPRRREGRGRRGWDPSGDDGRSGARLAGFAARAQFHVRPGGFQVRFRRRAGQATRGGQGAAGGCRAGPARGASQDGQRRERGERASRGAAVQPKGGISFDRLRGGLEKKGGYVPGKTNTSTASTVSSLATPPFPGRHAAGGMSASSDTSMAVNATLTAREDESGDPWSDPWGGRG